MTREDWVWVALKAIGIWLIASSAIALAETLVVVIGNSLSFGSFLLRVFTMALIPGVLGYYFLKDGGALLRLLPQAKGNDPP